MRSCGCLNIETSREVGALIRDKYAVEGTQLNAINSKKLPKNNTSGVRGVYWDKQTQKWRALIEFQGKKICLGRYKDMKEAIVARKAAEEKYYKPMLEKYKDRL